MDESPDDVAAAGAKLANEKNARQTQRTKQNRGQMAPVRNVVCRRF